MPILPNRTKWLKSDENLKIGNVVLFLKSDQEFDKQYQNGIVKDIYDSRDGHVRKVQVEYHHYNEKTKRTTQRGIRELVIILLDIEPGIEVELGKIARKCNHTNSIHTCTCR